MKYDQQYISVLSRLLARSRRIEIQILMNLYLNNWRELYLSVLTVHFDVDLMQNVEWTQES